MFSQHDRLHLRLVRGAPQLRRGRGLFTKPASCRCLGLCAAPPLAPDVVHRKCLLGEAGRRVTATRVSDFAICDDLIVIYIYTG